MMGRKIGILGAALIAATISTGATGATVDPGSGVLEGTGTVVQTPLPSGQGIDFTWTSTPFTAIANFSTTSTFNLFFDAFTSNGSTSDVTGLTLDILDAPNGTATTRFTNDTNFCASAAGSVSGNCNLFTEVGSNSGNAAGAAKPDPLTALLAGLGSGSYRLGVYDSGTPTNAVANFRIAEIPLPAAAWLFATAIGLFGASRLRKT